MIKRYLFKVSIKAFIRKKLPYFYQQLYCFWWQHFIRFFWLLRFKPKGVLVYVGLNKGNSFANIHYKYELAIGYEPNPELFKDLQEKFLGFKNVMIFNFAASDKNSEENFYISGNLNMVSSSLSKFTENLTKKIGYKKTIKVKTINLGEHLENLNVKFIDNYISDAQGYDLKILKSIERYIINNNVKKITCEVTRNKKDNSYYEADNFEKSFDKFLPAQYIKIGFGESNPRTGKFEDFPEHYDFYDVGWINNKKPYN